MATIATTRKTAKLTNAPERVPGKVSTLSSLSKSIVLPNKTTAQRIPTYPNVERTAVLAFRHTATMTVPDNGSTVTGPYSDTAIMLCGSPGAPAWRTYNCTALVETRMMYIDGSAVSNIPGAAWLTSGQAAPASSVGIGLPSGLTSYSLPVGALAGERYIYCPPQPPSTSGVVRYLKLTTAGINITAGTLEATVRWWTHSDETATEVISMDTVLASTTWCGKSATAYNRFAFGTIESIVTKTTCTWTGSMIYREVIMGWSTTSNYNTFDYLSPTGVSTLMLPLMASQPQIDVSTVPWSDTKLTACSLLVSNTTKVMNKEGTVNCARLNLNIGTTVTGVGSSAGQVLNAFCPTDSVFSGTHPSLRYFGPMESGAYTFLPHSSETGVFFDTVQVGKYLGGTAYPAMDLSSWEYSNVILLKDPDATTPSQLALTLDLHIEFRSSSTMFPVAVATTALDTYHAAVSATGRMCPFTENWIHVPAVFAALNALLPVAEKLYTDYQARKMALKAAQLSADTATARSFPALAGTNTRAVLPPAGFLPAPRATRRKPRAQRARAATRTTVRRALSATTRRARTR